MNLLNNKNRDTINSIKAAEFNYSLPDEKIAKYPLEKRDQSKVLIWKNRNISETVFNDVDTHLPANSMLVFNNTKVIRARLKFNKSTGANIEIFCLEPVAPTDHALAFQQTQQVDWKCMVGNAKKWKEGILKKNIIIQNKTTVLQAQQLQKENGDFIIRFFWDNNFTFSEILEHSGIIPIPPYLNRETETSDLTRYQTVLAKIKGSVAAPTAGLHFTQTTFDKLKVKNISVSELTLHVGAGTFQPVKSEFISEHKMHEEAVVVSKQFIKHLIQHQHKVIAVGTTSIRSLESLYWLGCTINSQNPEAVLEVPQWAPYNSDFKINSKDSLQNILSFMEKHNFEELHFATKIIIVPGYKFRIIDGMFTNFHQPQSTLLLLISAFLGDDWKTVYDYALANNFRFLSYGDSNLYLK